MNPPPTKSEAHDQITAAVMAVDEIGRQADERWGLGRLPRLVPPEWAVKFRSQATKFSHAIFSGDVAATVRHGDGMTRAYAKLEELALAAGHKPVPPEQWEFEVDGELVILVRNIADVGRADAGGRRANVWSLDEIANVVRSQRLVFEVKASFPGAELVEMRPGKIALNQLDDSLAGLPF